MAGTEQRPGQPRPNATELQPPERRPLISIPRSVIPACDVPDMDVFRRLVSETADVPKIGAYKVGFELALRYGMPAIMRTVREHTDKPVIYDHQKAGTDIPETGVKFAAPLKEAGVNSAILFPFGGAATERQWIDDCQSAGLTVIVGGHMTQKEFLVSEGGFIADDAPKRMYGIAAEKGVRDFVMPGNKLDYLKKYKAMLDDMLGEGNYDIYSPGLIAQGGSMTEAAAVAGERWHAIIGTALYTAPDIKAAAQELTSKL